MHGTASVQACLFSAWRSSWAAQKLYHPACWYMHNHSCLFIHSTGAWKIMQNCELQPPWRRLLTFALITRRVYFTACLHGLGCLVVLAIANCWHQDACRPVTCLHQMCCCIEILLQGCVTYTAGTTTLRSCQSTVNTVWCTVEFNQSVICHLAVDNKGAWKVRALSFDEWHFSFVIQGLAHKPIEAVIAPWISYWGSCHLDSTVNWQLWMYGSKLAEQDARPSI